MMNTENSVKDGNIMKISQLPSRTWYWLGMNYAKVPEDSFRLTKEGKIGLEIPEDVDYQAAKPDGAGLSGVKTGVGEDLTRLVEAAGVPVHKISLAEGVKQDTPVRINIGYEDGAEDANVVEIEAAENSSVYVSMSIHSAPEASGHAAVQIRYDAKENAKITLVQILRNGDDMSVMDDIGGNLADGADFHLIQVVLSGRQTFLGHYAGLSGKGSSMETDLGYQVKDSDMLDINYIADHTGRKTNCTINADGVLSGSAHKLFRGTIDFKKGCAGAKGFEQENVLLLDEAVENKTIPVILCAEEDVEGDHGASIGKLDDETMFYLGSRGIPEDEIYKMMARARIEAVSAKIEDEALRDDVRAYLDGQEGNSYEQ